MKQTATAACMSLNAFRSPNDAKNYRLLTLENGLEVVLVQKEAPKATCTKPNEPDEEPPVVLSPRVRTRSHSRSRDHFEDEDDEENEEEAAHSHCAAACMTVGVGSMADPTHLRGLAHYLEHMLFMGSEKYPDENAFESFLSAHGGYSNGATECECTRYLFEVDPGFLQPALDMFAHFFISPLFKHDAMERELRAIESEFNRAMQNDYVRLQQVQCETCAPNHPYDSFSWGNVESLQTIPAAQGIDVRAAMLEFYHQYYSANVMKLCVYGHDSLDTMQEWILESFGAIPCRPNVTIPLYHTLPRPFGQAAGQEPTLVRIVPVRKMHSMHLYWTLPPLLSQYRQKPWEYLSHVFGHECGGSITSILKQRRWATQLHAGISEGDSYEFGSFGSFFEINISLTRQGLEHWSDVVQLVFEFLAFTRAEGFHTWIFDELRASTEMAFRFQEEMEPMACARRLSELLQPRFAVDRCDLLQYEVVQGPFDANATGALLEEMTPANTRILLLSHSFEPTLSENARTERWFGAKYEALSIEKSLLTQWKNATTNAALKNPSRNRFMAQSFEFLPLDPLDANDPNALPELLYQSHRTKLWFKRDLKFQLPKANVHFLLVLPSITANVANYVHAKILLRMVNDALTAVEYQANIANLDFDLFIRDLDIEVTFNGFSDQLHELVAVVFQTFLTIELNESQFQLMKDELAKEYRNYNLKPAAKARYMRLQLLERRTFPIEDILQVLADVTLADLVVFQTTVMWNCDVTLRSLIHGNLTRQQALALIQRVETSLHDMTQRMPPLSPIRPHTTELPVTTNGILLRDMSEHDDETNSMVEVYYQFGQISRHDQAYVELLNQIMQEPLFHQLRTTQQLGYEVYCCVRDTHGVLGFSIAVQSASHPSGEIALCIDHFVHTDFWSVLQDLSLETFDEHVQTLMRMKLIDDTTMMDETYRLWDEIQSRRYVFDMQTQLVEALKSCSLDGLRKLYAGWFLSEDGTRKLRVHVVGKSSVFVPIEELVDEERAPQIIANVREYKKALTCHCTQIKYA